jgi:protein-L-isoaspartate O-methyltransferase
MSTSDDEMRKVSRDAFEQARDAGLEAQERATREKFRTMSQQPAYESWRQVMQVLEPLDPEQRKRVLSAVCGMLGIDATFAK